MKRLIYIFLSIFLIEACTPSFTENTLLEQSEISLIWKGTVQVSFNPATGQLGYNDSRKEYRVYDDKLADWFTVRCSELPSEVGQQISADVSWTGTQSPQKYYGLSFVVKQISQEGLIWLWNEDKNIGIIIKDIL